MKKTLHRKLSRPIHSALGMIRGGDGKSYETLEIAWVQGGISLKDTWHSK